jgi:hypothetical protein
MAFDTLSQSQRVSDSIPHNPTLSPQCIGALAAPSPAADLSPVRGVGNGHSNVVGLKPQNFFWGWWLSLLDGDFVIRRKNLYHGLEPFDIRA